MHRLLLTVLLLAFVATGGVVVVLSNGGGHSAEAATGPCGTTHDWLSAEESEFIALLQQWRNTHTLYPPGGSSPLTPSMPLNKAAAWFAEYQVNAGSPGGHGDNYGRDWKDRVRDCGYDSYWWYGSGEGVYALASSQVLDIGPDEAVDGPPYNGVTYPGSGATVGDVHPSYPFKCVGAAVARSADGKRVAWVVVLAQFPLNSTCPEPGGGAPPTVTTATNTPTATPTKTPTRTPTPTPPGARRAVAPGMSKWPVD
ncbi:MAG: hypothetical protein HY875_06285 [Chloroflexi bacterium]|nr:hypothetical protein [Chloroflexota bacterium]